MNAEMSRRLSEASFGFSKANFQMPILSLYETRESKLRINVFRSTSVIVGPQLLPWWIFQLMPISDRLQNCRSDKRNDGRVGIFGYRSQGHDGS